MLRGIRYGEADRILHLYTPDRGRVSAIAKGVRRAKSRFGGRLEPFFRLNLVLYEGKPRPADGHERGDARRPSAAARARRRARRRRARLRRREPAVRRRRAARAASTTCSPTSSRCSTASRRGATRANALAFRLKLLLAAGFAPHLASCASCGEPRAPRRLLRRRRRRRLRRLRGRLVPALPGGPRLPGGRARPPAGRGPGRRAARAGAGRPGDLRDPRAPRPRAAPRRRLPVACARCASPCS